MLSSDDRAGEGRNSYGLNQFRPFSSPVFAGTPPSPGEPHGSAFVGTIRQHRHLGTGWPARPWI